VGGEDALGAARSSDALGAARSSDALGAARSSDALGAGARLARPNARETSARRGDECDREGALAARSRASIEPPLEPRLEGCPWRRGGKTTRARVARRA
jgi:hypothetical protein